MQCCLAKKKNLSTNENVIISIVLEWLDWLAYSPGSICFFHPHQGQGACTVYPQAYVTISDRLH